MIYVYIHIYIYIYTYIYIYIVISIYSVVYVSVLHIKKPDLMSAMETKLDPPHSNKLGSTSGDLA